MACYRKEQLERTNETKRNELEQQGRDDKEKILLQRSRTGLLDEVGMCGM